MPGEAAPPTEDSSMKDSSNVATFAFVNDQNAHDSRSHAMREHWKKRRRTKSLDVQSLPRSSYLSTSSPVHPLLPASSSNSSSNQSTARASGSGGGSGSSSNNRKYGASKSSKKVIGPSKELGFPAQALAGVNLALGSCRLDPFDQFPVKLTAQHHKLLLHCRPSEFPSHLTVSFFFC